MRKAWEAVLIGIERVDVAAVKNALNLVTGCIIVTGIISGDTEKLLRVEIS
jgi:hypothetical protein